MRANVFLVIHGLGRFAIGWWLVILPLVLMTVALMMALLLKISGALLSFAC